MIKKNLWISNILACVREIGSRDYQERECILYDSSRIGKTVDIYAPNVGGARYSLEGEFIGFLEFKK